MKLIIEYELSGQCRGPIGRGAGLCNFCLRDGKYGAIDLVHGQKRRRHSRGGLQKFAAIHPHLLAVDIGERCDSRFDALLLVGLRQGVELSIGDDPGRHRRLARSGLSRGQLFQLFLAKPY